MAQRDKIIKWCFYALITGLFVLLQSLVLNRISWRGVHPFLVPMLVAVTAMWEGRSAGVNFALMFGLVTDLTADSPIPCFYMLLFLLISLLTSLIAHRWFPAGFLCALALSAMAMLLHSLLTAVLLGSIATTRLSAAAALAGRELIISLPFVLPVHWLYRKVHRAFTEN